MNSTVESHGDVRRIHMTSAAGRVVGIGVSVYVVRGVMIDTGFHRARAIVADAVRALDVGGAIVTHWHEDHAGNVGLLRQLGVPLSIRGDTLDVVRRAPPIQLYRRLVWGQPRRVTPPIDPFASAEFACVHTPGHSEDHQVVFDRETGTLFSGDLWLGVRARILHHAEDPFRIMESLRTAMALAPERMFDAHRGRVSKPIEALRAKAEWMAETIGAIERRIADGWTDTAIVRELFGGEELAGRVSFGEYARGNFVKAVRKGARR